MAYIVSNITSKQMQQKNKKTDSKVSQFFFYLPQKFLLQGFHQVTFQLCGAWIFLCVWKMNQIIVHWTHYLYSDWPKVYNEFSKWAPVTS